MRKVAIVGSEEQFWTPEQRTKVVKIIKRIYDGYVVYGLGTIDTKDIVLVSGGCPKGGVDIYAEIVADVLGIEKDIKYPEINQWEDKITYDDSRINPPEIQLGYKSRNIEIAETCDILYCIDPKVRGWKTGGQWTMRKAKELGKEVHLVEIE